MLCVCCGNEILANEIIPKTFSHFPRLSLPASPFFSLGPSSMSLDEQADDAMMEDDVADLSSEVAAFVSFIFISCMRLITLRVFLIDACCRWPQYTSIHMLFMHMCGMTYSQV